MDKNLGVRPIGIGKVARRNIFKSIILSTISSELIVEAGTPQLCAGQRGSYVATASALTAVFNQSETEGLRLVVASKAFNQLNMYVECAATATFLTNLYRKPANYHVDGEVLLSQKSATQGGPEDTPMYDIALLPLIKRFGDLVKQFCNAEETLNNAEELGLEYGYFSNASRTKLIFKRGKTILTELRRTHTLLCTILRIISFLSAITR